MNALMQMKFSQFTSDTDRSPGVVDAGEAQSLIQLARDINAQNSGCCHTSSIGDQDLSTLIAANPDRFDPQATDEIQNYLRRYSRVVVAPVPVVLPPPVVPNSRASLINYLWGWHGGSGGHHNFGHHGGHHSFHGRAR